MSRRTGSVCKRYVFVLLSGLIQKRFVTERVGKNNVATLIYEVFGGFVAFVGLVDIGFDYEFHALGLATGFKSVDKVFVVS